MITPWLSVAVAIAGILCQFYMHLVPIEVQRVSS